VTGIGSAAQPSGSKLPHHNDCGKSRSFIGSGGELAVSRALNNLELPG